LLTRKFLEDLQLLDKISDPALKALGRQALCTYYRIPVASSRMAALTWVVLVFGGPAEFIFLPWWKAFILLVATFLVCIALLSLLLLKEGLISARGFFGFLRSAITSLIKLPRFAFRPRDSGDPPPS
jgi:hypothetical protein